ncbi:MAG: NUDIX hydrolase [Thermodesulfobacteriota bacterium]
MSGYDWDVLESKYIVKDEWLSLRVDRCQMPNGRLVEPYYVFEFPEWVNIVAVTNNDEVVLVRQYRHGIQKTGLELPCGVVTENDTSPIEAARRELLEEVGYISKDFIETGRISANPANHTNLTHCFLAIDATPAATPQLDDTEQIGVFLTPLREVIELIEEGDIFQALHISSILLALKKLGKIHWK